MLRIAAEALVVVAVGAAGLLLFPAPQAVAEPRQPSEEAARYDAKGKAAYQKGRHDDAAAAFELAYRADPLPRFLHNLGRCYERQGDLSRAVEVLERYVSEETDPAERKDGKATLEIVRLRALVATRDGRGVEAGSRRAPGQRGRQAPAARRGVRARRDGPPGAGRAPPRPRRQPPRTAGGRLGSADDRGRRGTRGPLEPRARLRRGG